MTYSIRGDEDVPMEPKHSLNERMAEAETALANLIQEIQECKAMIGKLAREVGIDR